MTRKAWVTVLVSTLLWLTLLAAQTGASGLEARKKIVMFRVGTPLWVQCSSAKVTLYL